MGKTIRVAALLMLASGVAQAGSLLVGPDNSQSIKVYDPAIPPAAGSELTVAGPDGGWRLAIGDVDGDGRPDRILAAGPDSRFPAQLRVYSADGALLGERTLFETGFTGGLTVATADFNGDGHDDIVVGSGPGRAASVVVLDGTDLTRTLLSFEPLAAYSGGISVAAANFTGDARPEIAVGAAPNGASAVLVFNRAGEEMNRLFPFGQAPTSSTGLWVAAGDLDGDGLAEIVVAPMSQTTRIAALAPFGQQALFSFEPYSPSGFTGGVRVAMADLDGDGRADILTAPGPGRATQLRVFSGADRSNLLAEFEPYASGYSAGAFVAASALSGVRQGIRFSSATYSAVEGSRQATIEVLREGNASAAASVRYTTSGLTAGALDFTASTGTLEWAAGDSTSKSFVVELLDDALDEDDETVQLELTEASGSALGAPATAVLTLVDDDPTPTLSVADASNGEGSQLNFVVTLSAASGRVVTVNYATAPGTAGSADFTAVSGTLRFEPGEVQKTIGVRSTDDSFVESDEQFTLTLSSPVNATLARATATGTILDNDDNGTLQFATSGYRVDETAGSVQLTVTRSGSSRGAIGVHWATQDGTAIAPGDYASASGDLAWADGDSSPKTITVNIVDDNEQEEDERFGVVLSGATGGARLGNTLTAAVTIVDDDRNRGTIEFDSELYAVNENDGVAVIGVVRRNGSRGAASVRFRTPDRRDGAYQFTNLVLQWADGEAGIRYARVPIVDNREASTVQIARYPLLLEDVSSGARLGRSSAMLQITDDEIPTRVGFTQAEYEIDERAGVATVTIRRSGGPEGRVVLDYRTTTGTATAGSDYQPVEGSLSWADGELGDKSFQVTILDDSLPEPDETVGLAISYNAAGHPRSAGYGLATATLVIHSDDADTPGSGPGRLACEAAQPSVFEGEIVRITARRLDGNQGAVSVRYRTEGQQPGGPLNRAEAGNDFRPEDGTLSWADGDSTPKTISIQTLADERDEDTETFDLVLSDPTGGAVLAVEQRCTISLQPVRSDTLYSTVALAADRFRVSETQGTAHIVLTRSFGQPSSTSVRYRVLGLSATAGEDFTAVEGEVSWPAGDVGDREILVPILRDTIAEDMETARVEIYEPVRGSLGLHRTADLEIYDADDPSPPTLSHGMIRYASSAPVNFSYVRGAGYRFDPVGIERASGDNGRVTVRYRMAGANDVSSTDLGNDQLAPAGIVTIASDPSNGSRVNLGNNGLAWDDGTYRTSNLQLTYHHDRAGTGRAFVVMESVTGGATIESRLLEVKVPQTRSSGSLDWRLLLPLLGFVLMRAGLRRRPRL